MVIERVAEMLAACKANDTRLSPTMLYNEGWMLRLVLDWFERRGDDIADHALCIPSTCSWYSEAQLTSQFRPRHRGDNLGEGNTHADGVIGQFDIGRKDEADLCKSKGDLGLKTSATHFVVVEAKMFSGLSKGTKRAPEYDQAARNVACIAEVLAKFERRPDQMEKLGFLVLAPDCQIDVGVFNEQMTKKSICDKVKDRMGKYEERDDAEQKKKWFDEWFRPTLDHIDLGVMSWETVVDYIKKKAQRDGEELAEFYQFCKKFNAPKS